jgi:soluble lytic murein transglycosylase-like protein
MRLFALLILFGGLASAGEYALLTNGGRLRVDRHEPAGTKVRLYLAGGTIEIDSAEVQGFEAEEPGPRLGSPATAEQPGAPAAASAIPQGGSVAAKASTPKQPASEQLAPEKLANAAAAKYGLPPSLVRSVMKAESGFQPHAVSPKGAVGLMQLMPGTAQSLGANPYDPVQNVDAGTRYLRSLLEKYNGMLRHALAAYNAGPEAVEKHGGVPPFAETLDYIRRVEREWKRAD